MNKELRDLRISCLELAHKCKDGNLQSAFSCMEIIWTLYDRVMNWSPEIATSDERDFFIISKGQATLALYPVLITKGYFTNQDFDDIGQFNSRFSNQVDVSKFEGGIENSAGSLGHGLPFGTGIAMANKIRKIDSKVFVLCGDGEFTEGTMWESCIFASTHKLDNLCVIIDDNDSVGSMVDMISLSKKLESFGFEVYDVDGHDVDKLAEVLSKSTAPGKPKAVIAKTVRGFGSETLETKDVWFHKSPNVEELDMLIKEVNAI